MSMHYLFTPEGDAALMTILQGRPLIALDFDGTLAHIVDRPGDARIAPELAGSLAALAERLPVAIVTGRSVDDVKGRLGFEPMVIIGNHGAEGGVDARTSGALGCALDPARRVMHRHATRLGDAGVEIEDKGQSIALHFRRAPDAERARAAIATLVVLLGPAVRTFSGKMVENIVPQAAPDKGAAVRDLVAGCSATAALFAGDDVNDEPVFASAPPHWVTIRVGRDVPQSQAQYFIHEPQQMQRLIDRMLSILIGPAPSPTSVRG